MNSQKTERSGSPKALRRKVIVPLVTGAICISAAGSAWLLADDGPAVNIAGMMAPPSTRWVQPPATKPAPETPAPQTPPSK